MPGPFHETPALYSGRHAAGADSVPSQLDVCLKTVHHYIVVFRTCVCTLVPYCSSSIPLYDSSTVPDSKPRVAGVAWCAQMSVFIFVRRCTLCVNDMNHVD